MAAATAAAADAAVAAAQAAAAVIRLTSVAAGRASAVEEAAAVKIQSVFRSYLVRDYVVFKINFFIIHFTSASTHWRESIFIIYKGHPIKIGTKLFRAD